jgi:Amt family ammonium transporter
MDSVSFSFSLNTFYLLVSGALVMWMAAGFSMLEAGLVRSRNTVEILTKNMALYAVACLMYLLVGYDIMYAAKGTSWWPFAHWQGLLAQGDDTSGDYSRYADFFFQVVFVATAMSIVSGAVAERMKLLAFLAFAVIFTAFVYPLQGYWMWGGGFLKQAGFVDFAGSGVVHLAGAAAALAAVLMLGPRTGKYGPKGQVRAIPGHNLPLAALGTFILWLGWFGFNGGSELAIASPEHASNVAKVYLNTNMAAAAGVVAALLVSQWRFGKPDLTMALNGALAGLVAITADPLSPSPLLAVFIGLMAGVLVFFAIVWLDRKAHLDDPVGALSVHGINGIWGLLAVLLSNPAAHWLAQLLGIATIFAFVFVTSLALWWLLARLLGLRVTVEDEINGLDIAECGLEAYPDFVTKH